MEQVKEDRFVFQVEWFDKQADLIRNYLLTFYPGDGSIDMVSELISACVIKESDRTLVKIAWRTVTYFLCLFLPRLVRFEKQKDVPQENALPGRRAVVTFRRLYRHRQCTIAHDCRLW